jgi:peptidylprolyl isomerase
MLNINKTYLIVMLLSLVATACNRSQSDANNIHHQPDLLQEQLIHANKAVVKTENQQIEDLIERYGWNMITTGTGLRYQVVESQGGPLITRGQKVSMHYSVRLIDGTEVYSSQKQGILTFETGKGQVVAGLEEAMLQLRNHEKARVIVPSFLGHGLSGDGDQIPPKATMIYTIEIIYVE